MGVVVIIVVVVVSQEEGWMKFEVELLGVRGVEVGDGGR